MAACSSCGARLQSNATACGACGVAVRPAAPAMAVPDLDLGPVARPASRSRQVAAKEEVSLELSDSGPGSFSQPDAYAPGTHDRFQTADDGESVRPSSKKLPVRAPTAHEMEMAEAAAKEAEAAQIRSLAGYGPAPTALYLAPMYAFSVRKRRKELAEIVDARKASLVDAETKLETILTAIAERAMHKVEQMPPFAPLLHPAKLAEQNFRTKGGALAAEMDTHRARLADADRKIAAAEREATTAREALAAAPMDEGRKKAKDLADHKVASVRRERQALDAHWQKQISAHGTGVEEARGALRRALAQIARRVLADTAAFGPDWDRDREEVALVDKDVALKKKDHDRHVTAEASYDVGMYQKGFGLTAAGILFLVLCLLVPRTLHILGVL
ncbi:MAG: zinc ribbon domain-containing protein [Polyangiaceae bacterium]